MADDFPAVVRTRMDNIKRRAHAKLNAAFPDPVQRQAALDRAKLAYQQWGRIYNYRWPLELYDDPALAFVYTDKLLERRAQKTKRGLQALWNLEPSFTKTLTHLLRTNTDKTGVCTLATASLGGGPGSDLCGWWAFLLSILGELGIHKLNLHGNIIDSSYAWAAQTCWELCLARGQAPADTFGYITTDAIRHPLTDGRIYLEDNHGCLAHMHDDWEQAMAHNVVTAADVVIISHVLVDFPPVNPEHYFKQTLGDIMNPGSLLIVLDRFGPPCMDLVTSHQVIGPVPVPGTKEGCAMAYVAAECDRAEEEQDGLVTGLTQVALAGL